MLPRLPFRDDKVFSWLLLLTVTVPLAFYFNLYEKFETIKLFLWAAVLGAAFISAACKNFTFNFRRGFFGLLALFVLWATLATLFSTSHTLSIFGVYSRFTSSLSFYLLWALTLFLLGSYLDRPRWEVLIKAVFFSGFLVAFFGLLQSFGVAYYEGLDQAAVARAPGMLGNPNFSSMFLAALLPMALALYRSAKSFRSKLYYALGAFFMLWAIINFSSRAAYAALIVGLIFTLVVALALHTSKKIVISALGVVVLASGLILGLGATVRYGSLAGFFQLHETNVDFRLFAWDIAREIVARHPFFGLGPGTLQLYFEKYRGPNLAMGGGVFDDVHNLPLQLAAGGGIVLALAFLALSFYGLWLGYKHLRKNRDDAWVVGAMGGVVAWLLASCFGPVSTGNYLLLALLLAGLFINSSARVVNLKLPAKVASGILGAILILAGSMFFAAEILFYNAQVDFLYHNFTKSENRLNWAIKLNPTNQLYYLYRTADAIILRGNEAPIKQQITQTVNVEPLGAKAQVSGANLYYLAYDRTQDRNYLKLAIDNMQESLAKDKYFAPRYIHLGFYLAADNQLDTARESVKTALSIDKTNIPGWLLLARIYQLQKKYPQMDYALEHAFLLRPQEEVLKQLKEASAAGKNLDKLTIPAYINVLQIEP